MEELREEHLRKIRLFQSVDLNAIKGILDACTIRSLGAGEVLIAAGQANRTVYFLLEGRVRIHISSIRNPPTAVLGPGESIGEMSVIDHKPASAFAVAVEPVLLLAMEEEILWSLIQSSHAAATNLLIDLSTRLRDTDTAISDRPAERETDRDKRHFGTVDALTGLQNRHWLEVILDRQIQRAVFSHHPVSLIMIDIDNFKAFNERYGRAYGDHVLYAVAHTLSDYLRPTDVIARYGGDEFVVVVPGMGFETALNACGRLQRAVMNAVPVAPNGDAIPHPTISIGVSTLKEGQNGKELLAEADQALTRAKGRRPNSISA